MHSCGTGCEQEHERFELGIFIAFEREFTFKLGLFEMADSGQ
jgi:hypothetical protein